MEHGRDKIGPARDETMKKQLRGENRAEEAREIQPAGEDQPAATRAPGAPLTGATPHGMTAEDVETRAELAQHIGRSVYPADKNAILRALREHHAPDRLQELAQRLPADGRFENVQSVAEALGLGTEDHPR
jgi:hypothetical protein